MNDNIYFNSDEVNEVIKVKTFIVYWQRNNDMLRLYNNDNNKKRASNLKVLAKIEIHT